MSIEIFLDNYNNICYPGQTISGRIECTFNTEKKLKAIRVKFRGCSKTAWTVSEPYYNAFTRRTEIRNVLYSAKEVYMNTEYNLVAGGENFSLPAGKHIYPFSYILPPQLPSSFKGTVGNIDYYIKAVVDRPWKSDYKAKVPLNVASLIDLNFIPDLRESVAISDDKTMFSCWCKDAGAITFNLSMPISGYVPGQEIKIGAYVKNLTKISAESVKFKIVANYEYFTRHPSTLSKRNSEEIVKFVESGIGAHGEKSWTSTLVIPTNRIYPNLIPCSIINVVYNLEATVVVPFPHTNLELLCPITIGSVPLSDVNTANLGPPFLGGQFPLPNNANTSLSTSGLPGYPLPNSSNECYPGGISYPYEEKYPGEVPPPYLLGKEEGKSVPYPPMGGLSPYLTGAAAPPSGDIPSYVSSTGGSALYPPSVEGSTPYFSPTGGSAPYPPHSNGSISYPLSVSGSAPYHSPIGDSSSYPLKKSDL